MNRTLRWLALSAVLSLTACTVGNSPLPAASQTSSDAAPSVAPSFAQPRATAHTQKPKLEFIGDCGTVVAQASGFTPGGEYVTKVRRVGDEQPYTGFDNLGTFDAQGGLSGWKWPCKGDKPGMYRVSITDRTTSVEIDAGFQIHKP